MLESTSLALVRLLLSPPTQAGPQLVYLLEPVTNRSIITISIFNQGAFMKQKGFTLVELLIVIVVIAILASISIVSYVGIQDRARASKAKMNAASAKKVAEAYYSQNNTYPTAVSHFRSGLITLPPGVELPAPASLNSTTGENGVVYRYVGSSGNATGACVYYWDFTIKNRSEVTLLGTATSSTCGYSAGTVPTP